MYLELSHLSLLLASSFGYVAYEMFQGFDLPNSTYTLKYTKHTVPPATTVKTTAYPPIKSTLPTILPIPTTKLNCPEEEIPSNIGPYEVPSQKDLILLIRSTLIKAFNMYHQKALYFLKDIYEAKKATFSIENQCHGAGTDKKAYRTCVHRISNKCELITKTLVTSLERQRQNVTKFTEETICNIKLMKADPVQLIKVIAMEEASLEFALPGFLRLLGSCAIYCRVSDQRKTLYRKPTRHMTDQQLVVKHFLTKKNYIQLLQNP